MKIFWLFVLSLTIFGCTTFGTKNTKVDVNVICKWGTQQFDLCQYKTQKQMIDVLLLTMNLD